MNAYLPLRFSTVFLLHLLVAVLPTVDTLRAQSESNAPETKRSGKHHLQKLERLIGGEWQGRQQNTWHWGPGKHSIRTINHGEVANKPWRELQVIYWHPGHNQILALGINPYAGSVSEGSVKLEGETIEIVSELHQSGGSRKTISRDVFSGKDNYRSSLFELSPSGQSALLAEWDLVRSKTTTPTKGLEGKEQGGAPSWLEGFQALLGKTWVLNEELVGDWGRDSTLRIESTFEWVPYANYVYLQTVEHAEDGASSHLLDAYIFYHTGRKVPRCLVLTQTGGVYEGDLNLKVKGKTLSLELHKNINGVTSRFVLELETDDVKPRDRIWMLSQDSRTLIHDSRHETKSGKQ